MSDKTVAIIDDDEALLLAVGMLLEDEEYNVISISDPRTAIATLKQTVPHLIILDLVMPGIDGKTLSGMIRQHDEIAEIPIVLLSASHNVGDVAKEMSAAGYVSKPFQPSALITLVRTLMHKK